MKHAATKATFATETMSWRWRLGSVLAAVVLMQLGVWRVRPHDTRSLADVVVSESHLLSEERMPPVVKQPRNLTTTLQHACRHAFVPLNPTCPRQLVVKYLESAGFGHQFTELLFAMYAAQYLGLTFTWTPITTSGDHGDDYSGLVKRLGLERFFVDGLGLAKSDDLRELRRSDAALFGQWIETTPSNVDKKHMHLPCNNSVLAIEGWWHCRGVADNNCFWAPEHEFLFQRFGRCLRAGVEVYGTVMNRCVLRDDGKTADLPHDTLVVVWHLRFGDVTARKPGDAFFANVIRTLREIVPDGVIKSVRIVLVGGGKGMATVPDDYVDGLRGVVTAAAASKDRSGLSPQRVQVERFRNSSFDEQFIAMMQADVLVGSGSSVPQIAALLSGSRPVFFNHVAKHGYGYGQEAMADAVDMDGHGNVLDSLRRVRLTLYDNFKRQTSCRQSRARRFRNAKNYSWQEPA